MKVYYDSMFVQGSYSELTDARIKALTQEELLDTVNNKNVSGIFMKVDLLQFDIDAYFRRAATTNNVLRKPLIWLSLFNKLSPTKHKSPFEQKIFLTLSIYCILMESCISDFTVTKVSMSNLKNSTRRISTSSTFSATSSTMRAAELSVGIKTNQCRNLCKNIF